MIHLKTKKKEGDFTNRNYRDIVSSNLKKYRKAAWKDGIAFCKSSATFAEKLGINAITYKNYEVPSRKEVPDYDTLCRIASLLAVSLDSIFGRVPPPEIPRNVLAGLGLNFKRTGKKYEVAIPKVILETLESEWKEAQERGFDTVAWDKAAFTAVTFREEDFPAIMAHYHKYDRYKDTLRWCELRFRQFVFYMVLKMPGMEGDKLDSVDFFIRLFYHQFKAWDNEFTRFLKLYALEHPGVHEVDLNTFEEYATSMGFEEEVKRRIFHDRIAGLYRDNIFSECYRRYGTDNKLKEWQQGLMLLTDEEVIAANKAERNFRREHQE